MAPVLIDGCCPFHPLIPDLARHFFKRGITSLTTETHPPLSWKQQKRRAEDEEYIIQLKLQRNFK